VLSKPRGHIFPVEIATTKTVGALKDVIKDKSGLHLTMFQLTPSFSGRFLSLSESLDGNLVNFLNKESLSPVHGLSKLFSIMPKEEYLHIIIKGPSIEAIEPGKANDKLVAMVNSVYHIS
jgi:hypothetical protein